MTTPITVLGVKKKWNLTQHIRTTRREPLRQEEPTARITASTGGGVPGVCARGATLDETHVGNPVVISASGRGVPYSECEEDHAEREEVVGAVQEDAHLWWRGIGARIRPHIEARTTH
jgi:hypothetical protein